MEPRRSGITIPGAIIIAAAIIAIALIYIFHPQHASTQSDNPLPQVSDATIRPVSASDHILGNPNAPIKIVEYSDPSCPFCKMFNPTMTQIMDQYGPSGNVAWVYRDFPLDKPDENGNILHPNAGREAQALECAALIGGNDKFWTYEKKWYQDIPEDGAGRSQVEDMTQIQQTATSIGLDASAFSDCLSSGNTKDRVQKDYLDGINAGISGTPYSIIVTPSGSNIPLVGAQSYTTVKAAIDVLIPTIKNESSS